MLGSKKGHKYAVYWGAKTESERGHRLRATTKQALHAYSRRIGSAEKYEVLNKESNSLACDTDASHGGSGGTPGRALNPSSREGLGIYCLFMAEGAPDGLYLNEFPVSDYHGYYTSVANLD